VSQPQQVFFVATLLCAAGLGLLLPRGGLAGRVLGAALTAAGLGVLGSQVPGLGAWLDNSVFYFLAGTTVVGAIATVTLRNPVYAAIWFGMTLLGTAGLFLLAGAQFLAVATVVVYAGAILVTFLFVLMLANPRGRAPYDRVSWEAFVSAATGAVIVGALSMTVTRVLTHPDRPAPPLVLAAAQGEPRVLSDTHMARIGQDLFGRHLIAVEVAGTLLLVALVGAAVIVGRARGPLRGESGQGRGQKGAGT
jgi:NADH-quinone oxidoreductase subunit J